MKKPMTRKELEKELNISTPTFWRWVKAKKIRQVTPVIPLYVKEEKSP